MISCLDRIATEVTATANPHLLTAAAFNGSVMLKRGRPTERSEYVLSTKVGKLLKASKTAKGKEYFPFSP